GRRRLLLAVPADFLGGPPVRLLLAVALTLVLALPVAAQESEPPAALDDPADEPPAALDDPADEPPAAAADLAEPDAGAAGDEPAGLVGLDAGEQLDAEQLNGGAPAAVLIDLPGGQ